MSYHRFYLRQQALGLGKGYVERFLVTRFLAKVGYHDSGIEAALSHLVQVDKDA